MKTNLSKKVKGNELEVIKEQLNKVGSYLDPTNLEMDDADLEDVLTLGENWDDPMTLMEAMDQHPTYFARWSYIYRLTQRKYDFYVERYKTWESGMKDVIRDEIFDKNREKGMTANNSRPTDSAVNARFLSMFYDGCDKNGSDAKKSDINEYIKLKKSMDIYAGRVEKLKIVVEAFKQRTSMLVSMSSLLKSMVDNNLIILKRRKK